MTTGEVIQAALLANTTVVGLVGARIYPGLMPQSSTGAVVTPAIVYTVVSDTPENSLVGGVDGRLSSIRLQVDCYAKKYLDAQSLAAAVDVVLSALSSAELAAWRDTSRDLYDDQAQLHRVSADYFVQR